MELLISRSQLEMAGEAWMDATVEMMRYFTRQWQNGELSDDAFESAVTAYQSHLMGIKDDLPAMLRDLVSAVPLHDGIVSMITLAKGTLLVVLRAGDLQVGYFDVTLIYRDLKDFIVLPSAATVFEATHPEIIADEVDLAGSSPEFEHRFLLDPIGEMLVRFGGFEYVKVETDSREFAQ
jgi:hypothetical protein